MKEYIVFSLSSHKELAKDFAKFWNCQLGKVISKKFPDGESLIMSQSDVEGKDVIIIESTYKKANDKLFGLLQFIDSVNRGGARTITLFIPYMGYSRQEKANSEREPISCEIAARVLETAPYTSIYAFDLHHPVIETFFKRGIKNIPTSDLFVSYYKKLLQEKEIKIKDVAIISPDHGANKRADMLTFGLPGSKKVLLKKERKDGEKVEHLEIDGDVRDRTCIIIDDIISTGGTIVSATKLLKKQGAKQVFVAVSHGIFAKTAIADISKAGVKDIVTTNTIVQELPKKVKVLDILPLIMREL